jgi:branched-chain amino acid transport system permease protein
MLFHLISSGLSNGGLYALTALGLILVYRSTLVVNFAHGEIFMLGAFLAFTFHVTFHIAYPVALALAVVGCLLVGVLTERLAYRPLLGASAVSLVLASVGFSFLLKGVARVIWGGQGDFLPFPPIFTFAPFQLMGFVFVPQNLVILGGTVLCMVAVWLFLFYGKMGKMMRATADNRRAAELVGIPIERVSAITWGVGGCLGGVAGVLMAPVTLLYPDMGGVLLIKAFAAAIVGGFGSAPGAVLGGFIVGLTESLVGGYLGSQFIEVAPFAIIIVILVAKPSGLLGRAEVAKL